MSFRVGRQLDRSSQTNEAAALVCWSFLSLGSNLHAACSFSLHLLAVSREGLQRSKTDALGVALSSDSRRVLLPTLDPSCGSVQKHGVEACGIQPRARRLSLVSGDVSWSQCGSIRGRLPSLASHLSARCSVTQRKWRTDLQFLSMLRWRT